MASKHLTSPLVRHAIKRGYAHAQPKPQSSVLGNQTFITALDNGSPITKVTVAFKAGSRYEQSTERGVSHYLRASAGLTTSRAQGFITARKLAQLGASFTASGDREFIYYTLEANQENLDEALECLNNIISGQIFNPWDLEDNLPRLKYELPSVTAQVRAVDLLHAAAYRRGLGNSIFVPKNRIGSISSETLQLFARSTLTPERCAVAVVGDNQDRAASIAQSLVLEKGSEATTPPAKFYGGDARKDTGGELAHIALALPGAPAGTPQSLALAIAAKALGAGPVTKWGADHSPLSKAIGNIGPFAVAGFNASYSDAGLFGVVLSTPKDEAQTAVRGAVQVLRNPSGLNIKGGKNALKLQILTEADYGSSLSEALAAQGLYQKVARSPAELVEEIESIADSAVTQALSSASKSNLAMAAVGNLAHVPYADEL